MKHRTKREVYSLCNEMHFELNIYHTRPSRSQVMRRTKASSLGVAQLRLEVFVRVLGFELEIWNCSKEERRNSIA